jgi:hypothetical protein
MEIDQDTETVRLASQPNATKCQPFTIFVFVALGKMGYRHQNLQT